ncbi:hypothetical protein GCM10011375_38200 [Hymenobacter qilianensis]|uniref:Uncharacterized protein n=1 Tax=Hymenobacter qilianensis TaxID=1385715 RepID=A0ACB5PWX8_9BACT|nr:hypothetical protein GCM10011375_38200 [Hymenobacter qilianensis]
MVADEELLLASVVVFTSQLNLTPWLLHVAAADPDREVAQLLGALAVGQYTHATWDGLIPTLLGTQGPPRAWRRQYGAGDLTN